MSNPKNPFANFDFDNVVKNLQGNPFVKSIMENDLMQKLAKGDMPEIDTNALFEAQKKNLEALGAMNARTTEGMAELAKKQSSLMSEAMASMGEYAKKAQNGEAGVSEEKFAEAQKMFKQAFAKMQDFGVDADKTGSDVFEIAKGRIEEGMGELTELMERLNK